MARKQVLTHERAHHLLGLLLLLLLLKRCVAVQ
jgi:hypothetical protein